MDYTLLNKLSAMIEQATKTLKAAENYVVAHTPPSNRPRHHER